MLWKDLNAKFTGAPNAQKPLHLQVEMRDTAWEPKGNFPAILCLSR
jgi:hypothetical protein